MEFTSLPKLDKRKLSEMLVLPFFKEKKRVQPAAECPSLKQFFSAPLETHDFKGKEGEITIVYSKGACEKRIALLGLGERELVTTESLRRAYSSVTKVCLVKKITEVNVLMPMIPSVTSDDIVRGVSEGLLLPNYVFDQLKHESIQENPILLLKRAVLIGVDKHAEALAKKYAKIAIGVYMARDLVNGNAEDVTAQHLAHVAKDLAKKLPRVKTTVFNKKRIEKEKMGLLLAVNRASQKEPAFIIVEYRGKERSKEHIVMIGKGITFDTGGLTLKTHAGMETMRCDMAGAAAVLGTIHVAASLGLKVNLTAVIPAAENCIGSRSFKPGDVYKSSAGKTVEVTNTDAEGRLVLADAITYVKKKLKPTLIIDFATLTGAIQIALGSEASGMMTNDEALANAFVRAGSTTYERVWRMPLYDEYRELLKSAIADIRSTGGRGGGSIVAAMFLKEFVGKTPWAHFDIAGTAFNDEAKRYLPKNGTGVGVRLMIDYLEQVV